MLLIKYYFFTYFYNYINKYLLYTFSVQAYLTEEMGLLISLQSKSQNKCVDHNNKLNDLIMKGSQINLQNRMEHLKSLQIGTLYNGFSTQQGNVIWSCAANLCFNEFKSAFLKNKNLFFESKIPVQTEILLKTLNQSKFNKSQIHQDSIYVKSGKGNQIIKIINQQVLKKFPLKTIQPLQQSSNDGFVSYAYMMKALTYVHQFQRIPGILWFGASLQKQPQKDPYIVQAFSATTQKCLDQIKIIQYLDYHNFFIGFKAKNQKVNDIPIIKRKLQKEQNQNISWFQRIRRFIFDNFPRLTAAPSVQQSFNKQNISDVIYILSSQNLTIDQVIAKVMKAQQIPIDERKSNPNLVQFMMPVIDLDVKRQYNEFKNLSIGNNQLRGEKLKMFQHIKLRMDEKGVVVQNQAFIGKDQCAVVDNIEIKVDRPFWLVLTEQGKHPYLVSKINWLPEKILKREQQYESNY